MGSLCLPASVEAGPFKALRAFVDRCRANAAIKKVNIPLNEPASRKTEMPEAPMSPTKLLAEATLHPLTRTIVWAYQGQFSFAADDVFTSAYFQELRRLDEYFLQFDQRSFPKTGQVAYDIFFDRKDLPGAKDREYHVTDKGISKALLDYARSRWAGRTRLMDERLEDFEELLEDPRYNANSLWRWLFGLLATKSELVKKDPRSLEGFLEELLGIVAAFDSFSTNPGAMIFFSQETSITVGHVLVPSFDYHLLYYQANGDGRLYGVVELKRRLNLKRASDVTSLIRSTIEKAEKVSDQRRAFSHFDIQSPELERISLREMGAHLELILQVDWDFVDPISWEAGEHTVRRHPDGRVTVDGANGSHHIEQGQIIADIERNLSGIKGVEAIHQIKLMNHDGVVLGHFLPTDTVKNFIQNPEDLIIAEIYQVDPLFVEMVNSQSWIFVPGVSRYTLPTGDLPPRGSSAEVSIELNLPLISIIPGKDGNSDSPHVWKTNGLVP